MYDEKIINNVIYNFEQVNPFNNLFLIYKSNKSTFDLLHVKKQKSIRIFCPEKDSIIDIIREYPNAKAVICHAMAFEFAEQLLKMPNYLNFYWVIWGYDVYLLPKIQPQIYGRLTQKYIFKTDKKTKFIWSIKKNKYLRKVYYLLRRKANRQSIVEKAHKMVDFCVSYIREDFEIFKVNYPNTKAKFHFSTFLNIEQYVGSSFMDKSVVGNNILIGNSFSMENNHLDVFNFLSNKLDEKVKVFVPLSYGEDENYKQFLLKKGEDLLGSEFKPMLNFIPLDKYIDILSGCGVGIFYHYSQQAMGNIIAMLWLGARIYMSPRNPAFHYFQRIGIIIFSLDTEFDKYGNSFLSQHEVASNREILIMHFSKKKVENDYEKLIDKIYNN
jgi:hypothetical protein